VCTLLTHALNHKYQIYHCCIGTMVPNCLVSERYIQREIAHTVYNIVDRIHMIVF